MWLNKLYNLSSVSVLALFCLTIFFPFIGEVNLFDWHETLIASISKEMYLNKQFWTPIFEEHFYVEKPPLFFQMQYYIYKYLGPTEYASRLPNAICGFLSVLSIYKIGRRIYSKSFGLLWAFIYLSMFLSQLYHKSGLIEPWYNFFVFLSLYNMSRVIEMRQERGDGFYRKSDVLTNLYWSAFACFGAILTNGFEAYFVVVLSYWLLFISSSGKYGFGYTNILRWTFAVFFFLLIWVLITYKSNLNWNYFNLFWEYQKNDYQIHNVSFGKRLTFHFIILLIGCFPASILAFGSFKNSSYEPTLQKIFRIIMVGCLIVIFFIATFIKHKYVHYSSLAYFPISFLASYTVFQFLSKKRTLDFRFYIGLILVGLIWALILVIIPLTKARIDFLFQYIQDPTLYETLSKAFNWEVWEISFGIFFFIFLFISIVLISFKHIRTGTAILFFNTLIVSQVVLLYYLPKIERFAQGSYIDFIKNKRDENALFWNYNSTSHASSFYSYNAKNWPKIEKDTISFLTKQDHETYLFSKISDSFEKNKKADYFTKMYEEGLYVFYKLNKK